MEVMKADVGESEEVEDNEVFDEPKEEEISPYQYKGHFYMRWKSSYLRGVAFIYIST